MKINKNQFLKCNQFIISHTMKWVRLESVVYIDKCKEDYNNGNEIRIRKSN